MIALIVAKASNNVIGLHGGIPWQCRQDMLWFKAVTQNSSLIMGRKTFESLPALLTDREVLVVGAGYYSSIQEAISEASHKNIIFAGGQRIYEAALDIVDTMYITEIAGEYQGDTFFPSVTEEEWDQQEIVAAPGCTITRWNRL